MKFNHLLFSTLLVLTGCGSVGSPISQTFAPLNLIDGNYYYVTQSRCAHFTYSSESRSDRPTIECYSTHGEHQGSITGLTQEQYAAIEQFSGELIKIYYQHKYEANSVQANTQGYKPIEIMPTPYWTNKKAGTPVFSAEQCLGSIVGNVCYGQIINKKVLQPTCHGTVVSGECYGAILNQ
jgi:hypothetical protein